MLTLATMTGAASAQRTLYDSSGRTAGRSVTDSQGSVTYYDATGRVSAVSSNGVTAIHLAIGTETIRSSVAVWLN